VLKSYLPNKTDKKRTVCSGEQSECVVSAMRLLRGSTRHRAKASRLLSSYVTGPGVCRTRLRGTTFQPLRGVNTRLRYLGGSVQYFLRTFIVVYCHRALGRGQMNSCRAVGVNFSRVSPVNCHSTIAGHITSSIVKLGNSCQTQNVAGYG
jgi:hypothetical protein